MNLLDPVAVQAEIDAMAGSDVYLHLETTTGSYTALGPDSVPPIVAFVRNTKVRYERGAIKGEGPYRLGLKMDHGWVYGLGLTHAEKDDEGRLLMAGYDDHGQLRLAVQLSREPFREGLE